jgi:Fur family ferric uptake transcriptional regulator
MPHQKEIAKIRELLKDQDYRLTPQREAILTILLENKKGHMTAEDIYAVTRERYPEIGLATVYRTLELFQALGIVSYLEFGDGGRKYEISSGSEEHYHHHLLCLECGEIIEFSEDLLDDLEQRIWEVSKFRITDHSLRFFGICKGCVEKNES